MTRARSVRGAARPSVSSVTDDFTVREGNRRGLEAHTRLSTVLAVARKLFLNKGYAGTSLNDVVALAGGSKATVLKYFGNKAGLFAAVIADVSRQFVVAAHLEDIEGTPSEVLEEFGGIVLKFYLATESKLAYRGIVAEGHRNPSMAAAFYREGHERVKLALAGRLMAWTQDELVSSIDAEDDADLFLHLLRAGLYEKRLLGIASPPTAHQIASRVSRAVQVFLRGIATS